MKKLTSILLAFVLIFCVSCGSEGSLDSLWESARYTSDATVGSGASSVTLVVEAGEKAVTLTVLTDRATLGEALYELELVNDATFFDVCNGIKADWDKDAAYWAFYVGEELAMYGIGDAQAVTSGNPTYKLVYVYTK